MSKKRRVKKQVKDRLRAEVKSAHLYNRYATLVSKYKMSSSVVYVFDKNQSSRILNKEVSSVGHLLYTDPKLRDTVYLGQSNRYPTFDTSALDTHHNVVMAIRESRFSEKIKDGQLSGKAFRTLWDNYNKMLGEEIDPKLDLSPQQMYKAVTRLHQRGVVVFTKFGSIWLAQDFKEVMSDAGVLWTEMVIDFTKVPLKNLMGG